MKTWRNKSKNGVSGRSQMLIWVAKGFMEPYVQLSGANWHHLLRWERYSLSVKWYLRGLEKIGRYVWYINGENTIFMGPGHSEMSFVRKCHKQILETIYWNKIEIYIQVFFLPKSTATSMGWSIWAMQWSQITLIHYLTVLNRLWITGIAVLLKKLASWLKYFCRRIFYQAIAFPVPLLLE